MPGLPLDAWNIDLSDFRKGAPLNAHQKKRYDLVNRLLLQVPKRGRGLDYGCGLGDQVYHFCSKFDDIMGVDVTPERVEWANREFAPLQFRVCAPDTLSFDDRVFDTVLSSVVLNWVEDKEQYLRNAHRVLVGGGHLVLLVKSPDVLRNQLRLLTGKAPLKNANKQLELGAVHASLSKLGFEIVDTDCFYDPLAEALRHPKNILVETLRLPWRALKAPSLAHYYGILARKVT